MACFGYLGPSVDISAAQSLWRPHQMSTPAPSRSRSPKQALPAIAQHGELAFLNRDMIASDSIILDNPIVNEGAYNHPVAIVGSTMNGTIATCVQVTSFGNGTIMNKYPRPSLASCRRGYLAIDHHQETKAHDGTPVLKLEHGRNMEKQSYIHLDGFFQIETQYLTAWRGRRIVLAGESLVMVQAWLKAFMMGQLQLSHGPGIWSCLDNGPVLPLFYGLTASPTLAKLPSVFATPFVPAAPAALAAVSQDSCGLNNTAPANCAASEAVMYSQHSIAISPFAVMTYAPVFPPAMSFAFNPQAQAVFYTADQLCSW